MPKPRNTSRQSLSLDWRRRRLEARGLGGLLATIILAAIVAFTIFGMGRATSLLGDAFPIDALTSSVEAGERVEAHQ